EPLRRRHVMLGWECHVVELERGKREFIAVKRQRRRYRGVGLELQLGAHPRRRRRERYVEFHGFDQPIGRAVVFEPDGVGLFGAHDHSVVPKVRLYYACTLWRLPALISSAKAASPCKRPVSLGPVSVGPANQGGEA